ncbi:MAG: DNA polymerase III subunit gamma/tau [Xanthomonadaceae bacterium]|nr:DNA polymerase III subunit gamma/tau [Xanthomonadaceae bacterium]MDE2245798.1 DNA polymerase III subunit gamma/tau [Xanthomonadaceae bacterium]
MSYQVLARKWRPRRFTELVGQEHVVRALSNALDGGRMHHAYLFTGTRGVGKTTIARIFAKSLNCERGASADPCGECAVCTAVDAGRFVDLLEIDAASNTGVDDVREVIENAQYAPTRGRYKVYLVDEVHMLSKNAFNALLKTLEEPPQHVVFLLATTDPQKLPVTVLSRCLKFNLKRLLPAQIEAQMRHILDAEAVTCEPEALVELARAADGSLRDGLSLLDQAIAYGDGAVRAGEVRAMLGTIARAEVVGLIAAIAAGDGAALMAEAERIEAFAPDFGAVLDDLAALLHRVQLRQLVPGLGGEDTVADAALDSLAARLAPEDVQLCYQLAVSGRRDLPLAPDEITGFEMALLRMLAFRPLPEAVGTTAAAPSGATSGGAKPATERMKPSVPEVAAVAAQNPPAISSEPLDWEALIERAGLRGALGQLARHAVLRSREGDVLVLALPKQDLQLVVEPFTSQLEEKLSAAMGAARVRVRFVAADADAGASPAARAERARSEGQTAAAAAIDDDPLVQALKRDFGARVLPQSIRTPESSP